MLKIKKSMIKLINSIKDDNNKYNESYIEQNEILSEDNEKK